jgi:hypothetical protein
VSKKTQWKLNRLSCIINVAKKFNFYIGRKEQLFSFSMILFLNRNDEKLPHTRQIKIAGRNHILPPLGIAWKTKHRQFPRGNLNVKLSKMSSTRQSSS